ncbi:MAG: hypothetical protein KGI45_02340 [Patescibacteria group bacterium]|nr:hypothetical protein [Patescibacteria group bacterium]MDE1940642.1 hypothetical protein [Patescibacteria group bacterium]MDE1966890.1 hypothetical protein [Patescibacteria group bacterium]
MKKIISLLAVLAPSVALAQTAPVTDVNSLSSKIIGIGNVVTYILVAFAVIYIVWMVIQAILKSGSEDASKYRMNVIWGIVGLFIIVSIWGLVNIVANTFRTTPTTQSIPNFGQNTQNGGIPANQIPQVQ